MNQGSILKLDDLRSQAEPFLTEKAKESLSKKSYHEFLTNESGEVTHRCTFFGKVVTLDSVEDTIKELAEKINELADLDLIHSSLTHFIKYDFNPNPKCAVLVYVMVPIKTYDEIMKEMATSVFPNGEMPK